PPFHSIPGLYNFRDIGGYSINACSIVRRGLVFRCADIGAPDAARLAALKELGITHVFDLRSRTEMERGLKGIGRAEGIARVWCPVFEDQSYDPASVAIRFKDYAAEGTEGFTRAYTAILSHASRGFQPILAHLSAPSPTPCLIHCTAGKDRTGAFVAVLLSLLGVPRATIAAEYALTQRGLATLMPAFEARLRLHPVFADMGERGARGARNMLSARAECMEAVLESLDEDERWRGAEGYVRRECGLGDGEIEAIRKALTVE
ncbi:tyrosine phosphatase family-domain-containing protein, partial [Lineolata rhizophorae]